MVKSDCIDDMRKMLIESIGSARDVLDGVPECREVVSRRLDDLCERLKTGQFHLAALGQFKRGKSSILNALIHEAILPTSVLPLTGVPTFIRYGDRIRACGWFKDGKRVSLGFRCARELSEYLLENVSEDGNPGNTRGVLRVDVQYPSPFLRSGLVLIDTPGIGSTLSHNTETTLGLLRECDAGLFVVSADPPVTEVEMQFFERVRVECAHVFFVLNKMDYLDENELRLAMDFFRRQLDERSAIGVGYEGRILAVSAKRGLDALLSQRFPEAWEQCGLANLERRILDFARERMAVVLDEAVRNKARSVLDEALTSLNLALQSARLPLEDLERRMKLFDERVEALRHRELVLGDLVAGERQRLRDCFETEMLKFKERARDFLSKTVLPADGQKAKKPDLADVGKADEEIHAFFDAQFRHFMREYGERINQSLAPHRRDAESLIREISQAASTIFDIPSHMPDGMMAFGTVREPYWVSHDWSTKLGDSPVGILEALLPEILRRRLLLRRMHEQVSALATQNVENLRWSVLQSIDRTFLHFRGALRRRILETVEATRRAVHVIHEKRRRLASGTAKETRRLEALVATVDGIRQRIS